MKVWQLLLATPLAIVIGAGGPLFYRSTATTIEINVTDKERVTTSEDSYYLVYGEKGAVFKNTDDIFFGKFNSSSVQGQLEEGKNYSVTVAGWRIPILSSYQNIVRVED